jgi:hypothetical protein
MAAEKPEDEVVDDDGADDDGPMSATEIAEQDVAEHEDDGVENGDRMELVRTGLIRVHIGGTRYRLRRPFFGEFKKLRLAIEDVNDEIEDLSNDSLRISRQIIAEASSHDADTEDPDTYFEWRADTRRRQKDASRALTNRAEELRIEWWTGMWKTLSLDGEPSDIPAWVTSPEVPNLLLTHWRTAPSGRG